MADYRIDVKTGDLLGAGTNANVRIILHGKGTQTEDFLLDKAWRDDFERNTVDEFTVKSKTIIPEVERIELWRDSAGFFSSWYVDYIEVTSLATGITSMFPAMRWIKENKTYFISHIDTCLPQNDPFKDLRALELKTMQQTYQLEVKVPGAPAQVKELPEDEKFSFQYQFDIGFKKKTLEAASQLQVLAKGIQWKNIDDIKGCYVKPFDVPKGSLHFNDDAWFGRQRLAGLNSLIIKLCTDIPEKFGVTEAMVSSLLEGKTLKQAMEMKRLFILDLEILEGAPTTSSEFVVPAPIALFYFNNDKRLMPIAIQLSQQKGPVNPVFLPTDPGYTWMLAKMWFNLADAHYHQSLAHLTFTHLIMEGVAVSSKRQLSPSHPILKLLNPHFLYLMSINYLALGTLVNPGGYIDKYSNGGIKTLFYLVTKSMASWRLDVQGTLPEDLKSRGVFDQSVLEGAYHVRDDGMMFYEAIKSYVEEYVKHYYASEGSLTADYELQAWGKELVKSRDEGGVGMLGVPNNGQFETTDHLSVTLTAVIYTCSVGHAKANFQQYDEYGAPFSYPYMLIGTPPTSKSAIAEEDILKSVGNREVLLNTMSVTAVLSEKGTQSLGDFEKQYIVDPPAMKIVEKFREQLRVIGTTIDQRNTVRDISYEYLHPSVVPNAISI